MKRLTLEQIGILFTLGLAICGVIGTWYKLADVPAAVEKMDQRLDDHDTEFGALVERIKALEKDNDRRLDQDGHR